MLWRFRGSHFRFTHTCSAPSSCSSCSPTAPSHSPRRCLDSAGRTWHPNPVRRRLAHALKAHAHALKAHACNRGGKLSRVETPGEAPLERWGQRVTTRFSARIAALAGPPPQKQLLAAPAGSPKAAAVDPAATGSAAMTAVAHMTMAHLTLARLTVARLAVARLTVARLVAVVSLTAAAAVARTFDLGYKGRVERRRTTHSLTTAAWRTNLEPYPNVTVFFVCRDNV